MGRSIGHILRNSLAGAGYIRRIWPKLQGDIASAAGGLEPTRIPRLPGLIDHRDLDRRDQGGVKGLIPKFWNQLQVESTRLESLKEVVGHVTDKD